MSVICLCYNQASYVQEALNSILNQVYGNVELIIVDDASTDNSTSEIRSWLSSKSKAIQFIPLNKNVGNCSAFNIGFRKSSGKYIIDLAADDVLLPHRIAEGVKTLEARGPEWVMEFSDGWIINEDGDRLRTHYIRNKTGELIEAVPQGDVYAEVLARYFICVPSMFMRRSILEELGGYDESLAYEDFDFWVRAARIGKFAYNPKILVEKRKLNTGWSAQQYRPGSKQLETTYRVCLKAQQLNRNKREIKALGRRLGYELRQAIRHGHPALAYKFWVLKREVWPRPIDWLYRLLIKRASS